MSVTGYKRLTVGLSVFTVILLAAMWYSAWHATHANWDVRDARVAVKMIEKMRYRAVHSPVQEAALCLQDIVDYQTNWSWQRPDLRLRELVESERVAAVRDVIEYLRRITGEDLGETPSKWIEKYARQDSQR